MKPAYAAWLGAIVCFFLYGCDTKVERLIGPQAGDRFPDVSLETFEGHRISLHTIRARPLVVNVWATWCGPCRREMADLQSLRRRVAATGAEVIGVSIDSDTFRAREFVRDNGFEFARYVDVEGWFAKHTSTLPRTYILAADSTVIRQIEGALSERDLALLYSQAFEHD